MNIDKKLTQIAKNITEKLKNLDWSNPRVILSAVGIAILPFVAGHYVKTGLLLGICMAICILWILDKSPNSIRRLVKNHPLSADVILSSLAIATIGGYFGAGLTLGLGAIFCAVLLSYALSNVKVEPA